MQNIGASNAEDAFYRYKMPKLAARIEGRGNGIKTNVVNNVDIAKALERPPDYLVKYYGCELGAQTKYDPKTGTSIVNGAHDTGKLVELLEGFIKKYVQCYSCGNPETVFKLKRDSIFLKCKACGAISEVDMRHKLNGYILKHPPEEKLSKAEKKLKKAEKERLKGAEELKKKAGSGSKKEKKDKKEEEHGDGEGPAGNGSAEDERPEEDEGGDDDDEEDEEEDDSTVWATDTSAEAMQRRAAEQLSSATAAMVTLSTEEAEAAALLKKVEEAEAVARKEKQQARLAEAAAAKRAQAPAAAAAAPPPEEAEESEESSDDELDEDELVEELRGLASDPRRDPAKVAEVLRKIPIPDGTIGLMRVLYRALLGDPPAGSKLAPLATKHQRLLKVLAADATQQMAQLLALEYLLATQMRERVKEAPLVLKALYDADVVSEDVVLAWFQKVGAGRVAGVHPADGKLMRDAARPFAEWLQESDSEEEETDGETDEE